MAITIHWVPNFADNSLINSGRLIAEELIETLSAPDFSRTSTSSTDEMPPPTVKGILTCSATFSTISKVVFRASKVAEISKNTNSSAPLSAYCLAKTTGSPASIKFIKLTPFTVRPFLMSKHGMIRFVSIDFFLILQFYNNLLLSLKKILI